MKSTLDCLECIAKQALRAARIATDDPIRQRRIMDETLRQIPSLDLNDSPAWISRIAYAMTTEHSGNPDPYRDAKRAQNALALEFEPELRRMVGESSDPLMTALHLSAAGNIIDLGTMQHHEIDLPAVIAEVMREQFAVDHSEAFRASLATCKDLLFLLDNAGEIVFDKILIEELSRHTTVTAVVKGAPIINDALMEDAEQVGLTAICEVIDNGGAFIGSPLAHIPAAFRARMDQADVIIGKGQGNFETIDDHPGDVYLILRAKCEVVARHMGVRYGQVGMISTRQRQALQAP